MTFSEALQLASDKGGHLTHSPIETKLIGDAIEDASDFDGEELFDWSLKEDKYEGPNQTIVDCQVLTATQKEKVLVFTPADVLVFSYAASKELGMLPEDE